MGVNVRIGVTFDDSRKIGKTVTWNPSANGITCQLKEPCSIIRPVLLVNSNKTAPFTECNYVNIGDFARFYFITEMVACPGGYYEIHCELDPLTTFLTASSLSNMELNIIRAESEKSSQIPDTSITQNIRPETQIKTFGPHFTATQGRNYLLALK